MATATPVLITPPDHRAIPPGLFNACFVLFTINIVYFPIAFFSHWWIYDPNGLGIPTDFVNVFAAGKLVLDGTPALAYDWDVQKKVEVALLARTLAIELEAAAAKARARGARPRRAGAGNAARTVRKRRTPAAGRQGAAS